MQVQVDYPLQHMSPSSKEAAQKAISRIKSGGGTNLSGGLFKGVDQHQQGAAAEGAPAEQDLEIEGNLGSNPEHSNLHRVLYRVLAMVWVQPCNAAYTMNAVKCSCPACN